MNVEAPDFRERDIFLRRYKPLSIVLVAVLIPLVCLFVLAAVADHVFAGRDFAPGPELERFTSASYLAYNTLWLIITLVTWYFYCLLPKSLTRILNDLTECIHSTRDTTAKPAESVPDADAIEHELRTAFAEFSALWDHRAWPIVAAIPVAGLWLFLLSFAWPEERRLGSAFWLEVRWYLPVFMLGYTATLYPLWLLVTRAVVSIFVVREWFTRFHVRVSALHPDGVGGLSAFSGHIRRSLCFMFFFGVVATSYFVRVWEIYSTDSNAMSEVLRRPDVITILAAYVVAAPLSLLLPLLTAHARMLDARDRSLKRLSDEYDTLLKEWKATGGDDKPSDTQRLSDLGKTYKDVRKNFPVWPIPHSRTVVWLLTTYAPLAAGQLVQATLSSQKNSLLHWVQRGLEDLWGLLRG